jgi:hypothetical protein
VCVCLQELWGEGASEMLTVQYRMNSSIMDWSSQVNVSVCLCLCVGGGAMMLVWPLLAVLACVRELLFVLLRSLVRCVGWRRCVPVGNIIHRCQHIPEVASKHSRCLRAHRSAFPCTGAVWRPPVSTRISGGSHDGGAGGRGTRCG